MERRLFTRRGVLNGVPRTRLAVVSANALFLPSFILIIVPC